MKPESASDSLTFNLLSSNLQELNDKIKVLKFNELHEELKLMQYERDGLREQLEMALTSQKKLTASVATLRANETKHLQRIEELTNELRVAEKTRQDALASSSSEGQRFSRLELELHRAKESLEFANRKAKAGSKMLDDFFREDPAIQTIIREQIWKQVETLEKAPTTCDNQINIASVYTEEFLKILVLVRNDYVRKGDAKRPAEPEEEYLAKSDVFKKEEFDEKKSVVKSSRPLPKEDLLLSRRDVLMRDMLRGSKIEKKDIMDAMASDTIGPITENVREIWENIQLIRDKIEANTKVEETEKFLEVKNKNQRLKGQVAEVEAQANGLRQQLDLKDKEIVERNYLLVDAWKTTRQLLGKETDDDKFKEEVDNFDRFKFELKFKNEIDEVKKRMVAPVVQGSMPNQPAPSAVQISKRENDGHSILNEREMRMKNDFISKLQAEKASYETTVQAYHLKVRQLNRKIAQMQSGMPFGAKTGGSEGKQQDVLSAQMIDGFKSEIAAKEEINRKLGKELQEMTEKMIVLNTEKITVARKKEAAEEAFRALGEQAMTLRMIAEKAAKVFRDNTKLRAAIEAFYAKATEFGAKLKQLTAAGAKDFTSVIDEMTEALRMAHENPDFNSQEFQRVFNIMGMKQNDEAPRPSQIDPNAVAALQNTAENQGSHRRVQEAVAAQLAGKGGQIAIFSDDKELIVYLNKVLVENSELKGKLDVREKRIIGLNKDLLQFKRKTKEIGDVEQKIESLVTQNARLKVFVMELHSTIMEKTAAHSAKVAELTDQLNASEQILNTLAESTKRITAVKKGLEKRNYILQDQMDHVTAALETKRIDAEREVAALKATIEARDRELEPLRSIKQNCVRFEKDLKKKDDEIDRLLRLNELKNTTIDVLEKNLGLISETGTHDKQRVVQQLETMRQQLMEQIGERTKLVSEMLAMKVEVTRQREVAQEKEDLRATAEESLKHAQEKNERLATEIREVSLQLKAANLMLERLNTENEALRIEKRATEAELMHTRANLETYVKQMRDLVAAEREKITEELTAHNKERFAALEQKFFDQQKALSEAAFASERLRREVEELETKLEAKNKQLFQFNQYFVVLEGTKNVEKVEFTQLLIQNKGLLKEVENLRGKVRRLTEKHENLLTTVQEKIGVPAEEEVVFEMDLLQAKNGLLVTKFEDGQRAKVTHAVRLYEDRLAHQERSLKMLQNKLVVAENEAKSSQEQLQSAKVLMSDMKSKMTLLKEENRALLTHRERQKLIEEEIRTRNASLANQNNLLNEKTLQLQNSMLMFSQLPKGDPNKSDIL